LTLKVQDRFCVGEFESSKLLEQNSRLQLHGYVPLTFNPRRNPFYVSTRRGGGFL
jgi:hypothetical protein